jgi:hypothetical protein
MSRMSIWRRYREDWARLAPERSGRPCEELLSPSAFDCSRRSQHLQAKCGIAPHSVPRLIFRVGVLVKCHRQFIGFMGFIGFIGSIGFMGSIGFIRAMFSFDSLSVSFSAFSSRGSLRIDSI